MEREFIYTDLDYLESPLGRFSVIKDGELVPFALRRNPVNNPYEIYDPEYVNVIGTIETKTNYEIAIPTSSLVPGEWYTISFSSGEWNFGASDEHTDCFYTKSPKWVVGIGSYNPNDEAEMSQAYKYSQKMGILEMGNFEYPDSFDETDFREYVIKVLDNMNGYSFKVLDSCSLSFIRFPVAWVGINDYSEEDYVGAVGFWLT